MDNLTVSSSFLFGAHPSSPRQWPLFGLSSAQPKNCQLKKLSSSRRNELTISDQVLGDMKGDFDNKRAADVRGAHEANHTAGDADQGQGGLIHRTSGRAH